MWLLAGLFLTSLACSRKPAPPEPYLACAASRDTNTVAVINLAETRVVASIAVSAQPIQLAVSHRRDELFVVGALGTVDVIRYPELRVVKTLHVGAAARELVLSPLQPQAFLLASRFAGNHPMHVIPAKAGNQSPEPSVDPRFRGGDCAAISTPLGGPQGDRREAEIAPSASSAQPTGAPDDIVEIDCESLKEVVRVPAAEKTSALALTPDGKVLLASEPERSVVRFIDAATLKVTGSVQVGKGPGRIVVLPNSSKAFVADTGEEKISSIDIASRQVLSHIEIGLRPGGLLLKPDGGELFVLGPQASTLVIIDAFHDNVSQTFPTGREPVAGVFRKDSSVLYLANAGDGSATTLDVQNRQVLASTHVGQAPRALALTPDERFLAVADTGAASLAILVADPARLAQVKSALVTTVPVGAGPVDVAIPGWEWKQ